MLLLSHPREARRRLGSAALLRLCLASARLDLVEGRGLASARRSAGWRRFAVDEGRTPLLLYPSDEGVLETDALRARLAAGERFFLVVPDGTWAEAREMLTREQPTAEMRRSNPRVRAHAPHVSRAPEEAPLACLALPTDAEEGAGGLFAGCRQPFAPGCVCTLEAVARALQLLEPCAADGAALARALTRPMLRMVELQQRALREEDGEVAHHAWRPGYVPGLHDAAGEAAARAGVGSS